MTALSARTRKEARAVLYPWAGVILLCALPLLSPIYGYRTTFVIPGPDAFTTFLFQLGIFMGIPLLASLSFGNEFRYKTLDLLVSQPVNRLKIWREKWIVTAVAILATVLVATISSRTQYPVARYVSGDVLLFLIVITCSAPFWTLVGKSTLGGFALNIVAMVPLMSMKSNLWVVNSKSGYVQPSIALAVIWAAALAYSGFMLWLGRRMLVHRQSRGGFAGLDFMGSIPRVLPAPVVSLFECRPNQAILNLIRKEVRLLRPLWLFTSLYVVGWSALAASSLLFPAMEEKERAVYLGLVAVRSMFTIIALMMAASVAHGEERAFGVPSWHLVLPISIRTQWLIRFVSATIAAVLVTMAVPAILMALAREVLRPDFMQKLDLLPFLHPVPLLIFFLCAFWCGSVARDIIRTAGLMVGAGGLILITVQVSMWLTEQFMPLTLHLRMWVLSRFQLDLSSIIYVPDWIPDPDDSVVWLLVALLVAMTVHTYSLFRRLPREGAAKLLRPLLPYLAVIAVFAALTTARSWQNSWRPISELYSEVESAIVELPSGRTYKVEDLATVRPLNDHTPDLRMRE
jgi:hypothetical protein